MKFAFIIMGDFNLKYDHAAIHQQTAQIIGVTNLAEASIVAKNYLLKMCIRDRGKIEPTGFIDVSLDVKNYPDHDYHYIYIGEIESIYVNEKD